MANTDENLEIEMKLLVENLLASIANNKEMAKHLRAIVGIFRTEVSKIDSAPNVITRWIEKEMPSNNYKGILLLLFEQWLSGESAPEKS